MFFNRFWPQSNRSTKQFSFDLNLELQGSLKVGGSKINSTKSCSNQKILADLLLKVDFGASDFEAAVLLQIEVN